MNGFQNVVSDSNRYEGPQSIRSDDTSDATHPTSPVTRGCLRRTKPATPGKYVGEANAAVILEVAKAIGAYLELSEASPYPPNSAAKTATENGTYLTILERRAGRLWKVSVDIDERRK